MPGPAVWISPGLLEHTGDRRSLVSAEKTTSAGKSKRRPAGKAAASGKRTATAFNRSRDMAVRDTVSPPSADKPGGSKGSGKGGS